MRGAVCERAVFSVSFSSTGLHLWEAAQVAHYVLKTSVLDPPKTPPGLDKLTQRKKDSTSETLHMGSLILLEVEEQFLTFRRHVSDICLEGPRRTRLGHKFKLLSMPFLTKAKTSPHLLNAQGRSVLYY